MGNLIIFEEKAVKAKGLNKDQKIDGNKLKDYFFDDEFKNLRLLDKLPKFDQSTISLLYPGCGTDILTPLIYLEKLFPKVQEARLILVDEMPVSGMIKTILDEVKISFSETKEEIEFYWKEKLIKVKFVKSQIQDLELPEFNVYFERAFRIMKDQILDYEEKIYSKLASGGIIISDSGFENFELDRVNAPLQLSAYGEMVIGKK